MLSILAAAVAQTATPAAAALPAVITRPVWATVPSAAEFTAIYPPAALRSRVEGRATVRCMVDIHGALVDCTVTQEDPPGAGFGDAALRIAALFLMRAVSQDGIRTTGGVVSMPIRFKLPEEPAPKPVPTGMVIQNPAWVRKPSGEAMAAYFPKGAQNKELEGGATVRCEVAIGGTLDNCVIVAEDPLDEGFGAAALKLTSFFAMKPEAIDGKPVAGGTVRIPIQFLLPGEAILDDIVITLPTLLDSAATIDCRAQPRGVDNCRLVDETTKDGYAGSLAMQLAPKVRLKVQAAMRFRVRFVFKKGEAPSH